jgi:DNA-binding response OmpR family regulator
VGDVSTTPASATLLVVEDDEDTRNALVDGLTEAGFNVQAARDGAQALQMMLASKPHLVILDLMMPRMTGWQLLDEMKEHPSLRDVPVAIVTAAGYSGTVPGGYPVWVKPLRMERLTKSIRAYLG